MPDIQNIPTTQYIGPRIIPHLWDPILWDASTQYDALAVVQYNGTPYIARYVPPQGTLPTDTEYWVRWADFNAQMAQLQQTVESFDNRITANATDIDTLEAIVPRSAFSSTNTVQKAINDEVTARQQAVSAEASARESADSALSASVDLLSKTHFGVIGDSFSEGMTDWPRLIAPIIGKTPIVKAVSGTGFVTGTTFKTQLQNLASDANFNKCAFIIVYGGVNDWRATHATSGDMRVAFNDFINAYDALDYKPRLIFAFGNMGRANLAEYNDFGIWYQECMDALYWLKMPGIADYVPFWLWENVNWFMADHLHPNDDGQKIVASRMMQLINGTYAGVYFRKRIKKEEVAAPFSGANVTELEFNNGITTLQFRGSIDNSWSSGSYYAPAGFGTGTYAFGAPANTSMDPEITMSLAKVLTNKTDGNVDRLAAIEFGFNPKNTNALIYCIGDPSAYTNPVAIASFVTVKA